MVSIIKPFFGQDGGSVVLENNRIGVFDDWIQFDTEQNHYVRSTMNVDSQFGRNVFDLDLVGSTLFERTGEPVHYRSSEPADLSTRTVFDDFITVNYRKNNTAEDRLIFPGYNQTVNRVLLDGEPYSNHQAFIQSDGNIDLHILNLPQGEHQIEIHAAASTGIPPWELY